MALQRGESAGEYMSREDWLKLATEQALVAIRLNGWTTTTVKATGEQIDTAQIDVFVLSGSRDGEVRKGENVFGKGLVTPLRRVTVGEEVAYQLVKNKNGATEYAAANAPDDAAFDRAVERFDELLAAEKNGKGKAKATASIGGGSAPTDDDLKPDF